VLIFKLPTAGVPIKLLLDAEGHLVTVELKNGEIYRGMLQEVEETMNCQLKEGTWHHFSGQTISP
jgi:small nuclear ribonucleoprotein D3